MLTHWSIKDLKSFFCLLYNCLSLGYDKLLFHERNAKQWWKEKRI